MKPADPKVITSITIPPGLLERLDAEAEAQERSRSQTITMILRAHFHRRQEGNPSDADHR